MYKLILIIFCMICPLIFFGGQVLAQDNVQGDVQNDNARNTAKKTQVEVLSDYLGKIGADFTWAGMTYDENSDVTVLGDARIVRYGKRFEIDRLHLVNNGVVLEQARIFNIKGGDGRIAIERLELSDLRSFMDIFIHVNAAPYASEDSVAPDLSDIPAAHFESPCGGLGKDGMTARTWTAHGMVMSGDMNALPESLRTPESIHVDILRETRKTGRTGNYCRSVLTLSFRNAEILAIDGARGHIASGSLAGVFESSPDLETTDHSHVGRVVLHLDHSSVANSSRIISASLDRLDVSWATDGHMNLLLCNLLWPSDGMTTAEMLEHAIATRSNGEIIADGLWLSVPGFLPADMIRAMGLEGREEITGHFEIKGRLGQGHADLESELDIAGVVTTGLSAGLDLPQVSGVTLPGFIAEGFPVPDEVLGLKIHHLSFFMKDSGLGDIVFALTGIRPAEHVGSMLELAQARVGDYLPGFVAGRLSNARDVLTGLIEHGGRIDIIPDTPQTVLAFGLRGMMYPGGLPDRMGVVVSP